jgi:hypothetical protein
MERDSNPSSVIPDLIGNPGSQNKKTAINVVFYKIDITLIYKALNTQ